MNTGTTWQTFTSRSEDTFAVGEQLGSNCRGGEIFVLSSDLGGGKTTLTKGIASGIGSKDVVSSPTFTVSKEYQGPKLTIRHFDFYRLEEGGMVAQELAEYLGESDAVLVVEWGGIVDELLPKNRISVNLERLASGENDRKVTIICPVKLNYLLEGLRS